MKLLLDQIELLEELRETHFKNSSLEKLTIFKSSKTWHFHIQIEKLLPINVFLIFKNQLEKTFQHIASIEVSLSAINNDCTEAELLEYWDYFITQADLLPTQKELITKQTPEITNRKIVVSARNEAEASSLRRNLEGQFNTFCQKISVPICTLAVEVKACADDLQKFREETKQEDRKLALEMVQNQQKQEQSKEKSQADKPFI